jgi:hypothetical protein
MIYCEARGGLQYDEAIPIYIDFAPMRHPLRTIPKNKKPETIICSRLQNYFKFSYMNLAR